MTDQPTITLVHGSHEQPIEQTTQTVKVKTNQLTSQPASQRAAEQTYLTTPETKDYDPPCLANFIVREGKGRKGRKEGREKWLFKIAQNRI